MYSKLKQAIKPNKPSNIFLLLLTIITTIITYYLIKVQVDVGIAYWDIFVYLDNALRFAGMGVGNQLALPPFMPFLTSIFFRMGFVSESTLFTLNGILFILGTIGLYLFFKLRFNSLLSFTGSLIFASFTIILSWAVTGATDVPAITFSIWALYFTVLATKRDPKFFYPAFILAAIAFLTRYTSGFIIILMLFYILIDGEYLKYKRKIAIGTLAAAAVIAPFLLGSYIASGNLFPFIGQFGSTVTGSTSAVNPGYNLDMLYYLKNIFTYISSAPVDSYSKVLWPSLGMPSVTAYIIVSIILIGALIYIYNIIQLIRSGSYKLKNNKNNLIKILIFISAMLIFILTFGKISYMISEIILLILAYMTYTFLKGLKIKNIDIDVLFLTWFMAYFILHSHHAVKVDRYFITMTPALAFFAVLGIKKVSDKLKIKIKTFNIVSWILPLIVVFMVLSSTSIYIQGMPNEDPLVKSEKSAVNWLKNYDSNYKDKIICSDRGPAFSWYFKKYVHTLIPRATRNETDFYARLKKINPDYYLDVTTKPKLDISGYHKIKNIDAIEIYEKDKI